MKVLVLAALAMVSAPANGQGYADSYDAPSGEPRPSYAPIPAPGAVYSPTPVYTEPTYAPEETTAYAPPPTPVPVYPNPNPDRANQNPPRNDLTPLSGLTCPRIGYMFPDPDNLCFVWFCEHAGEAPIKRPCPKGVRVPSWWEGGELNMCNIVNIVKHGGDPVCLRCDANDVRPNDNCVDRTEPCPAGCTCIDTEHTHRCDCPFQPAQVPFGSVPFPIDHCSPNPCENGASCQNQWDGFFCFCPNGFTGHRCETPICDWHPCMNGGTCVVDEIGYHCECTDCFSGSCCTEALPGCGAVVNPGTQACNDPCRTGPTCENVVNSCYCGAQPCAGGYGTCRDVNGEAICEGCDECYTGADCKQKKDTCKCNDDCPANSVCHDVPDANKHECVCEECSTMENGQCVPIFSCECNNPCGGQQCTMFDGQPICGCSDSCYTGPTCSDVINSCACNNDCPANSVCVDGVDGKTCACNDCYVLSGDQCSLENTCECNNPCGPGQQCTMDGGYPTCGCSDSCYTGASCSDVINSCACNNDCPANSVCVDGVDGKTCACNDCYVMSGDQCVLENTCECNNPCGPSQQCTMDGGQPTCGCADACYRGADCNEVIDSCDCNNDCGPNSYCVDGANGKTCPCDACHSVDAATGVCALENTCECNNPCGPGEQCTMVGGYPQCGCANACMTGPDCSEMLNNCECNDPCVNGGVCQDSANGPVCAGCNDCYTGDYCQDPVVSCTCNNPCSGSEECVMEGGAAVCQCPPCYQRDVNTGLCDVPIDNCECNNQCQDVNTCQDLPAGGTQCVCDCIGNEECKTDRDTNEQSCKCPLCFYNRPGEEGCLTPVTHLCDCNNPCTGDQQVCVNGAPGGQPICKIGNPSSGNAFTVVFEENETEKSFREIPLELYMTPSTPDSGRRYVNIRSAGLAEDHHCYFNINQTVEENSVLRFPVERCMMHNKTGLENLAIRLTELNNDTMIVYGINKDRWTADGFLATPDFQAGTVFQTVSYAPAHISTQFAITALFDDTDVEIELADDNDLPPPYNTKGSVYRLTMNAFETFQVQARCPNAPKSKRRQCTKDLSGSVITANNKIHVFSGNVRAFVKAGEGLSRDHLVEEMIPTDRWGKKFGMVSVPGRAVGDVLNIMAKKNTPTNIDIYYNGQRQSISLPMNGRLNTYVDIPSNQRLYIESDQPLSVTQLTKSKDTYLYQNETVHDPVTITIPPIEQFTNNFFISTPLFTGGENFELKPYMHNYALLVANAEDAEYITLNRQPLSNFVLPWGALPKPAGSTDDLVGAVIEIPHGTQMISSSNGANFQCLIYGFDDRESYGFPAAMNHARTSY